MICCNPGSAEESRMQEMMCPEVDGTFALGSLSELNSHTVLTEELEW